MTDATPSRGLPLPAPRRRPGFAAPPLWLAILGVAIAYFAAARFGFLMAFATKQVTAVWPPTGIAFVAYVVFGFRIWPGVFLGAFLANALSHETLTTALGIAVGNSLAGVVGVSLIRRIIGPDCTLERFREVLGLILLGGLAGSVISASNGVVNLALSGIVAWDDFGSVWWVWWIGDSLGVVLIAPLLLASFYGRSGFAPQRHRPELALFFGSLGGLCFIALSGEVIHSVALFRVEYAVFPFIIWTALRFSQRETAAAVCLIASFAIWGAIHDRGPFAVGRFDERLTLLDLFLATTSVTGLTLGAAVSERRRAERELKAARDQLEVRVVERTKELATANTALGQKNEEVEAFVYIVSHDLRAPLVNLQGFSRELETSCYDLENALAEAPLAPQTRAKVRQIVAEDMPGAMRFITASTTKFERLIEALLTLSRYGRQEFSPVKINMAALLSSTTDAVQQQIKQRGAAVTVGRLPDARGDVTSVGQVFANLIGNAIKFLHPGRPGAIEIGGEVRGGHAHYWVRDNGSGIPARVQKRLFQVFQRFHPHLAAGEGMGLALVKRIVERHGGQVHAVSEEGVGTTVHFSLLAADPSGTP